MRLFSVHIRILILGLCLSGVVLAQPQLAQPEIQIIFPDQAAIIDGQYIDNNHALVIKIVDGLVVTETFSLAELTGLNIPDNTAVTGFSGISNGGAFRTYSYIFSLSTAVEGFSRNDVIECDLNGCGVFQSFAQNAQISSLDYINRINDLYVSFDTSFEVNNDWIRPHEIYRAADYSIVYQGSDLGLSNTNVFTAFDTSELRLTFSPLHYEDTTNGLIGASSIFTPDAFNVENVITEELADEITGINAYFSVDSGWAEFEQDTINVSEGAGTFTFDIARINGVEGALDAVALDIDGTAVDGVDYNGLLNQYSWPDGSDQNIEVTLNIIDNFVEDGNRTFTIELRERNNDFSTSLINPNKRIITVNIIDDDGDLIFADGFE